MQTLLFAIKDYPMSTEYQIRLEAPGQRIDQIIAYSKGHKTGETVSDTRNNKTVRAVLCGMGSALGPCAVLGLVSGAPSSSGQAEQGNTLNFLEAQGNYNLFYLLLFLLWVPTTLFHPGIVP